MNYFSSNHIAQQNGLDDIGSPASDTYIRMELVQDTKEELYWGRVPSKVKAEALAKSMASAGNGAGVDESQLRGRKRKRQKGHASSAF